VKRHHSSTASTTSGMRPEEHQDVRAQQITICVEPRVKHADTTGSETLAQLTEGRASSSRGLTRRWRRYVKGEALDQASACMPRHVGCVQRNTKTSVRSPGTR
jgi:hypothetical protein